MRLKERQRRSVSSVPVSNMQRLVGDDIAGRAKGTSVKHFERHLILLPPSRRSVSDEAIMEAKERTPPQHSAPGTAIEELNRN